MVLRRAELAFFLRVFADPYCHPYYSRKEYIMAKSGESSTGKTTVAKGRGGKKLPAEPGSAPNAGDIGAVNAPSKSRSSKISIERLSMKFAAVFVRFLTPLLMNAKGPRTQFKLEQSESGKKIKKGARDIVGDYLDGLHICCGKYDKDALSTNLFGFPSIGFKKAMASTAYATGLHKNKVDVLRFLFVNGPYDGLVPLMQEVPDKLEDYPELPGIPLHELGLTGERPKKYTEDFVLKQLKKLQGTSRPEMHKCIGNLPTVASHPATMIYRGQFFPAVARLDIQYWPNLLDLEGVVSLLEAAGQINGVGSWRQENGGRYGMFQVAKVHALPDDYVMPQYGLEVDACGLDEGAQVKTD